MSDDVLEKEDQETAGAAESDATEATDVQTDDGGDVQAPEFSELDPGASQVGESPGDLNRLREVQVNVEAVLGRTVVPIQDLLKLTEGSVFELNRSIDSPVELIAQGVPLGNGEVVVVDDNFAIRIQEIYEKT